MLRYIVCRGMKPGTDAVREFMFTVNLKLNHLRNSESDVVEVVPLDIMKGDTHFYQHMVKSNEKYGHKHTYIHAHAHIFGGKRITTCTFLLAATVQSRSRP